MHHGRSLASGHYTSFVRDPMGQWRNYDDAKITKVTEEEVMGCPRCQHSVPYLLFYERM